MFAANGAWWAISGKKGKGSSRGKDGNASQPTELDSVSGCDSGSPDAGVQKKEPEALKSCLKMPARLRVRTLVHLESQRCL